MMTASLLTLRAREQEIQTALGEFVRTGFRDDDPTLLALRAELAEVTDTLYGDSSLDDDERGSMPCIC